MVKWRSVWELCVYHEINKKVVRMIITFEMFVLNRENVFFNGRDGGGMLQGAKLKRPIGLDISIMLSYLINITRKSIEIILVSCYPFCMGQIVFFIILCRMKKLTFLCTFSKYCRFGCNWIVAEIKYRNKKMWNV